MTIALDSEIVASRYDRNTHVCYYTIERNGERYTVAIPLTSLSVHKGNKQKRRDHVARALENAIHGAPDPHAGTKDDPHKPVTAQDFAKIRSGEWYINPADGRPFQKP